LVVGATRCAALLIPVDALLSEAKNLALPAFPPRDFALLSQLVPTSCGRKFDPMPDLGYLTPKPRLSKVGATFLDLFRNLCISPKNPPNCCQLRLNCCILLEKALFFTRHFVHVAFVFMHIVGSSFIFNIFFVSAPHA